MKDRKETVQLIGKLGKEVDLLAENINTHIALVKGKKVVKYKYEEYTSSEHVVRKKKMKVKVEAFFLDNYPLEEDDVFYVLHTYIDKKDKVQTRAIYYGAEMSSLTLLVNSDKDSDEVFLAEATSKEAVLAFIDIQNKKESVYVFKVSFKDFKLTSVKSLYQENTALNVYLFNRKEDDEAYGEVLKVFGQEVYSPKLDYFM